MKRRAILVAGVSWMIAGFPVLAQVKRIAALLPGTQSAYRSRMDVFRAELKKLGQIEGRDISIDARWADYDTGQLPALAAQLVALKPAVILTASSAALEVCRKTTSTIPIVFATAGDPVGRGVVTSLRRPGGNVTGVLLHSGMSGKIVEIAREALPQAKRLAILVHEPDPAHKWQLEEFLLAAKRLQFEPVVMRVTRAEDLAVAFNEMLRQRPEGIYLSDLSFLRAHARYLIERSLSASLPLLSAQEEVTAMGGMLSYGTVREENYRRAAAIVDKILRGASPAELPIEQPEQFRLVINEKTAKAIGVSLSPAIMLRAQRVIH